MPRNLVVTAAGLARRLNAITHPAHRRGDGKKWNRDNVRRFLEAVSAEPLPRKVPRGKLYWTEASIREALPEFWEALLDLEARAEAERAAGLAGSFEHAVAGTADHRAAL